MTLEIGLTLLVLLITIILFVTEFFRVDITALLVLVVLPWLGLIEPLEAFSGLASNAVIAVIAVMIMGYGLEQSGAIQLITGPLVQVAGREEKRLTAVVSASAGIFSAFVQNIGVIALFLPVVRKISRKTESSLSRILMPVGFAALLGGSLTMVGSGNLIILNDLLLQGGQETFNLFSVTPIGLVLLLAGVVYFFLLGGKLLPDTGPETSKELVEQKKLVECWDLATTIFRCKIPEGSSLQGLTQESAGLWGEYGLYLLALKEKDDISYAPWRFTRFSSGQELIILGRESGIKKFSQDYNLQYSREGQRRESGKLISQEDLQDSYFAELLLPPRSDHLGKTIRQIAVRKNFSINPLMLIRGDEEISGDFSDLTLQSGDIIVFFGLVENIKAAVNSEDFINLTPLRSRKISTGNPWLAGSVFLLAIGLILLGFELSLSLFSGALLMVLLGLIPVKELYRAVDWQTVFLLTGLIPLGLAMEKTGTAEFLSVRMMTVLEGRPVFLILLVLALLASIFTLFMSNVASTAVLVPLVMILGEQLGINPRALAMLVAVCASNSFILPTHQVNAFLMNPGGYSSKDYLKAGGLLSLLYIMVAVVMIYLFYL